MTLLEKLRADIRAALDERTAHDATIRGVVSAAEARNEDLTADETAAFTDARAKLAAADLRIADLREREAQMVQLDEARAAAEKINAEIGVAPKPVEAQLRGGKQERTYTPDAERRGVGFLRDIVAARFDGSPDAQQRLARHSIEARDDYPGYEQRAAGTGAFAGLVVPQYLTDMVAPAVAAMRPTANIMNHHDLPSSGMTLNISRITTATSAALQASENSAVSSTDIDDTLLTITVQTAAGQQILSRQAIDRGTGTEEVTVGDLIRRYHTVLDSTIITQATTGLDAAAGVSVTYTDASPTGPELYPKLFDLIQQVQTAVYMGVSHFVMHPRRWAWLASQVGTSWPFLQINGAGPQTAGSFNGTGIYNTAANGVMIAGTLAGVPVIVDANIATNLGAGTNEDRIYGVTAMEAHLWEDPAAPLYIRAEQTAAASLGVLFVVYGYFAYTFQRYASAMGKISGTGLITPTF